MAGEDDGRPVNETLLSENMFPWREMTSRCCPPGVVFWCTVHACVPNTKKNLEISQLSDGYHTVCTLAHHSNAHGHNIFIPKDNSYNNSTHSYYPNPHSVLTHSHNPISTRSPNIHERAN